MAERSPIDVEISATVGERMKALCREVQEVGERFVLPGPAVVAVGTELEINGITWVVVDANAQEIKLEEKR